MSKPANLEDLSFQVINVVRDGLPNLSVVMVVGMDENGKLRLWVDDYSTYFTEHNNDEVRAALKSMVGRSIPFFEAPDFIREEWVWENDGMLEDDKDFVYTQSIQLLNP